MTVFTQKRFYRRGTGWKVAHLGRSHSFLTYFLQSKAVLAKNCFWIHFFGNFEKAAQLKIKPILATYFGNFFVACHQLVLGESINVYKKCHQLISATWRIQKNSWVCWESNLGLLGEKCKSVLCCPPVFWKHQLTFVRPLSNAVNWWTSHLIN